MSTVYVVFTAAVVVLATMLLSRNSIKRAIRQKKMHAVISMVRQVSDK